jgi:general secretion pathway protein D
VRRETSPRQRFTAAATLVAFGLGLFPADSLADDPKPPFPVQPFRESLKRRDKFLKGRPKFGEGAKKAFEGRPRTKTQPVRPPPPPPPSSAAAGGKKDEDKSRPLQERHLRPWPKWRRGRIDFDKADIRDVAKFISEITGKNIILSDKARGGKLTIFSPASVTRGEAYQAFLAALEVNNLTAVGAGKFLKIVPQRDAKEMPIGTYPDGRMPPNDDRMVTVILHVKHGDAKEINNVVSQLKNKNGFNLVYAPTNAIIVADVAANVRRLMRIVRMLDVPTGTREKIWAIKIEHSTSAEIVEKLNQLFGDKAGPQKPGQPPPPIPRPGLKPGDKSLPSVVGESAEPETFRASKMIADERTNQIIVVCNEATYLRVLSLVARLDVRLTHDDSKVHVYYLQNAEAETVATVLSNLASGTGSSASRRPTPPSRPGAPGGKPSGGASASAAAGSLFEGEVKVSADKATNSLVVVASAKDFERLKRVIAKLDIRRRQVFVEAVIMEISMTKSRQLGLAFNAGTAVDVSGQQVPIFGGTTFGKLSSLFLDPSVLTGLAVGVRGPAIEGSGGLLSGAAGATGAGGIGINLPSFGVILRALQSTNDVNVLSTPHILSSDNEEAEILVGQNVPFITGGGFGGGLPFGGLGGAIPGLGGIGGAAGLGGLAGGLGALGGLGGFGGGFPLIQRQDVALTLKLTPQINAGDFVKLKVEQEVNDLAGDDPIRGPTTTKRRVKTVVSVKDQQTVVIGGLIRDNYTEDINKVPILGDVPIIGYFFRDTAKRVEKRNLILFLTPHIIKDQSDFQRIFRQKMKERQEFLERFASETKDYKTAIDYSKRHGMVEEINQTVNNLEQRELDEARVAEDEKKKAAKEKEYEILRAEEVRPLKEYKRIPLDKLQPASDLGSTPPSSRPAPERKPDTKPGEKVKPDADGVRDE